MTKSYFKHLPAMRLSTLYISFTIAAVVLSLLMVIHASYRQTAAQRKIQERADLVANLKLTDLCLFTEARYTRHPAMSDSFAPFQDYPGALEHFPSGSLVSPPMRNYATKP